MYTCSTKHTRIQVSKTNALQKYNSIVWFVSQKHNKR